MTPAEIEQAQPGDERRVLEALWKIVARKRGMGWALPRATAFLRLLDAGAYLDAAMMLTEPTDDIAILIEGGTTKVALRRNGAQAGFNMPTPALALCAAIARAGGE